jgi:hypothetical protein
LSGKLGVFITEKNMVTLSREFDACGECRLEIGGVRKYGTLTDGEIRTVVLAPENAELKASAPRASADLPILPLTKWQESMATPNVKLIGAEPRFSAERPC